VAPKRKGRTPRAENTAANLPPRRPVAQQGLVDEYKHLHPVFSFALTDWNYQGEWGWNLLDGGDALRLVQFMYEIGKKTWNEVFQDLNYGRKKHHGHPFARLCPAAQERLSVLGHDDEDTLFRFRDGRTKRLWGFHASGDGVFYVLWWDPNHQVFPTEPE